ncbi:scavenger receptor cysteine-rich type 1 protein M130 isoform X1 [Anoplopoma fimbria]|uniref:scavenger receptor cysteine-rich type 1 protein M130 isoform X1 n=1 Tax=Anoplopoma fimbria TaxID=229290 RepID=UPI0023EAD088|nr:scavenger receptor cysteine-rich type 1 protein M130 isoform X1 [Anoplopoma fimbria]
MMWFLLLLLYTAQSQPVITQGQDRIILKDGNNPCKGYIGIYHDSKLGYVGHSVWSNNTEKVVCRSTHCGEPKHSTTMTPPWPIDKVWINDVECKGSEHRLWDCTFPGWDLSHFQKGSLKKIECSHTIKIALDGFKCAGAVKYSTDGGVTYPGYFCDDNWGKMEADLLCQTLGCDTSKEIPKQRWKVIKRFGDSKKMKIKCSGLQNVTHLWQCAVEESSCNNPALVICTGHERLQLKGEASNVCSGRLQKEENEEWKPVLRNTSNPDLCQHMYCGTRNNDSHDELGTLLTCSDNVKVVLKDKNLVKKKCYGVVHIEVNKTSQPVCASNWNDDEAKVVCSELNCGSVFRKRQSKERKQGIMDNVKCSGNESSLWYCRAKRDHNHNPFTCDSTAHVVCTDSMSVRLMDGPGKCAGRVEIEHEGKWKRVDQKDWKDTNSDIVCRLLGCGNKGSVGIFSQGSGVFLAYNVECNEKTTHISECLKDEQNNKVDGTKAIGITCSGHKVVFLKANKSCSGMVGLQYGIQIYWLSGSNRTWNQESANTVCQQNNCGNASSYNSIRNTNMNYSIWPESYNCLSSPKSLFDCENTPTPTSDHNDTIATVNCSGNIKVDLANKCWGNVKVCLDEKCGEVCADTWTKEKSEMLCKKLKCGYPVESKPTTEHQKKNVTFISLHSTKETTDLSQCNFVKGDASCVPAYVVCSGSIKAKLNASRDKCYGNVEVDYEGQSLPVCKEALKDSKTQNAICEKLGCGPTIMQIASFGPIAAGRRVISQIQCDTSQKSLEKCTVTAALDACELGGLQCSGWSKIALTTKTSCSGAAFLHWHQDNSSAISREGLTTTWGGRLCQSLGCGKLKSMTTTTSDSPLTTRITCTGKEENIWGCVRETTSNQSKQQLFLECEDEPNVTLSERCYGAVKINGIEVCNSNWKDDYSHLICQEQKCGNAIPGHFPGLQSSSNKKYHHVRCEDNHYHFGQCKRFKGKCDGRLVSIYCVNSVQFNTTAYCGGQIEVKYGNKSEKVCAPKFTPEHSDMLCKQLKCEGHNDSIKITNKENLVTLGDTLNCTDDHLDIRYCLSHKSCGGKVKPAEIYCKGYKAPTSNSPEATKTSLTLILLVVGFTLVLVILIVVFIRIFIVKKAKERQNVPRMFSKKEVEFESGEYDDVLSKANEMEEFSRGGFRSEAEVITENDARSTSSFPYDDIDDVAVARPLTSGAATACATGDDRIHEGAPEQSPGKFPTSLNAFFSSFDKVSHCQKSAILTGN